MAPDVLLAVRWTKAPFRMVCRNLAETSGKTVRVSQGSYPAISWESGKLSPTNFTASLVKLLKEECMLDVQFSNELINIGPSTNHLAPTAIRLPGGSPESLP